MDMKSATPPSWEPASIDMGLSIESKMDNRGEEKKGERLSIEEEKEREVRTVCLTVQRIQST
jgi:hypothetical protein